MTKRPGNDPANPDDGAHPEMEEYQGGNIQAHHGHIPAWLLVVYLVLALWGLYYAFNWWGGLGPGRIW